MSIKNTAVISFIGMPIGLVVAWALAVQVVEGGQGACPRSAPFHYLAHSGAPLWPAPCCFLGAQPGIRPAEQLFVLVWSSAAKLAERDPKFTFKISPDDYGRVALRAEHRHFLSALKAVPKSFL